MNSCSFYLIRKHKNKHSAIIRVFYRNMKVPILNKIIPVIGFSLLPMLSIGQSLNLRQTEKSKMLSYNIKNISDNNFTVSPLAKRDLALYNLKNSLYYPVEIRESKPTALGRAKYSSTETRHPWVAAYEVIGMNVGLHLFDRYALDAEYAQTTWDTIKYNFRHGPVWDNDNISTNLFWHPYTGSLYFNAARSNGLNFWTSILYAFGGSFLWEYFGESEPPSINDLIATPIGGIALGEITHRISYLILDDSKYGWARFGRELAAGIVSPMGLLNRLFYGDAWRHRPVWTDKENTPHYYERQPFLLEVDAAIRYVDDVDGTRGSADMALGMRMIYGQPFTGNVRKPYDYFTFGIMFDIFGNQPLVSNANALGLLWGHEWGEKSNYWLAGAFQHFDYYDADPVVEGGKRPYEFAETASFGGGLLYKRQPDENKPAKFFGGIYANAVLLGASESDYYMIDQRDYNLGSGYSVKLHGLFMPWKRWGFYIAMKHYQFYTWKGYGSPEEERNGLPAEANYHYANVQGNKGNARLSFVNTRIDFQISQKFHISYEELYYTRRTHYEYMDDVKMSSTESRIRLTYNFLSR